MFSKRSDLPLDNDSLSKFLPWLIAFMVFLAVLSMFGMLLLASTATRWDQGISGTLTIQVLPADNRAKDSERLQKVLLVLEKLPEVERFEVFGDEKMKALLEPWLGSAAASKDLPLPRLIDVELKSGLTINLNELSQKIEDMVPNIAIDSHSLWLERIVNLTRVLEVLAIVILAFIGFATVGTVVFTTRTGLAIHRNAIEVLHLIGAQDSYIASQFASRALTLGLKGGGLGLCLSIPTMWTISAIAKQMETNLLPNINFGISHFLVWLALPVVIAFIAMFTARLTVLRTLSRML
ncbi:MAG: FtsX-like permease family protein [Pseudomonadota bacterium]|nr:FtsX-like permease family protein [Pseudomonadota bacterium]